MRSWLLLAATLLMGAPARAGVGPETTLLVVNADSPLSITLANHWLARRPIPASHLVWLHDIPGLGTVPLSDFKAKILEPVIQAMRQRGIEDDIDTIVYSADFPYAVKLAPLLKQSHIAANKYIGRAGALTGLTFFTDKLLDGDASLVALNANQYFRRPLDATPRPEITLPKEEQTQRIQALKLLKTGRYDEAAQVFERLSGRHPTDAELRLLLARAQAGAGQLQGALKNLETLPLLGYRNLSALEKSPELAPLRKTARFQRLLHRLGGSHRRVEPPIGFSRRYHWSRSQLPRGRGGGDRYYLSALLAYSGQRGNSLDEMLAYLDKAAASDLTHPKGTVYLMVNNNVRSKTRQPWFETTCQRLAELGHACTILTRGRDGEDGVLPKGRTDIIGVVVGKRHFNWEKSGSRLLPGAIAEALTSFGGDFDNASQTKLTEFLRHGAAASSGAVTEPYAFWQKFPLPLMHYYYALGYSLGEAWYQAVASPYQTILVGDPLTRPFGDPLKLELDAPPLPWRGRVRLEPHAADQGRVARFELWIDGHRLAELTPGEAFQLDTKQLADGYHHLHLVAVEPAPREGRIGHQQWIQIQNRRPPPSLRPDRTTVTLGETVRLQGRAPARAPLAIYHHNRLLAKTHADAKGEWRLTLATDRLGSGPVPLQVVADPGGRHESRGKPVLLEVRPGGPRVPPAARTPLAHQGFRFILQPKAPDAAVKSFTTNALDGKRRGQLKHPERYRSARIQGAFRVNRGGFHQLAIRTLGPLRLTLNGRTFQAEAPDDRPALVFFPLHLEPGWYELELETTPQGARQLRATLAGAEPPRLLSNARPKGRRPRS